MARPDYNAWDIVQEFTVEQAAYLIVNLEPRATSKEPIPAPVQALARELGIDESGPRPDRKTGGKKTKPSGRHGLYGPEFVTVHSAVHRYFNRETLEAWCEAREKRPPFLYESERGAPPGWPYAHDTHLLEVARWAIESYWEDKDAERGPSKDAVILELRKKFGLSKNAAAAVDLVTRPDSRRHPGVR